MRIKSLLLGVLILFSIHSYGIIVSGSLYSGEDDSPLIGQSIFLISELNDTVSIASTDNSGKFRAEIDDNIGKFSLKINVPGYEKQIIDIINTNRTMDLGKILLFPPFTELQELEVSASNSRVIGLPDKFIIFPQDLEKERAINPLNLLAQISYSAPIIRINEQAASIEINNQNPQILINGVRKSYSDFNALNPKNILKIEFITHPDIRFGVPYLNIITIKPESGGSVMAYIAAPVTTVQENHQVYGAYRRGMHEVALNYSGMFRDSHKEYNNDFEKYIAPDKLYEYNLYGEPSRTLDRMHNASLEYSIPDFITF